MAHLFDRLGGEIAANTATMGSQSVSKIASLAGGGFVVVWQDASGEGGDSDTSVKAQLFDAAGNKIGGEFLVNTATTDVQTSPSVAALENGGFAIAWTDWSRVGSDTSGAGVKAQVYDATGAAVGGEFLVNTATNASQSSPSIAGLDGGGFVISWNDNSAEGGDSRFSGVKAQRFDAAGAKVGGEFLVNTAVAEAQQRSEVAALDGGGFAITYSSGASSGTYLVQLFDSVGTKVGTEQTAAYSSTVSQPRIASLGTGYIVAWNEGVYTDSGVHFDVKAQLFDASGAKVGWSFAISTETAGDQTIDGLTSLPDGGVLATWTTPGTGGTTDIHAQVFDPDGRKSGIEFTVNAGTAGAQSFGRAAVLASGDVAVAWVDSSSGNANIEVQLLTASTAAPSDIAISTTTVSETAPEPLSAATLSASGGALNASYGFAIVSDSTGGAFAVAGDQLVVVDNFLLDYETSPTVEVRVRASDADGLSFEETLTLNIADAAIETRYAKGDVFRVNVADTQEDGALAVTPLASGGFLAAHSYYDSGESGVRVRLFNAEGRGAGDEIELALPLASSGVQFAALPDGGFVAVFDAVADGDVANPVKVQRYDSAGNEVGGEAILDAADSSGRPSVAVLGDGGFVVTWTRSHVPAEGWHWPSEVQGQRFDSSGAKVGGEFALPADLAGDQYGSEVAALPGGGFVAAWFHQGEGVTDDGIVQGQFFDAAGARVGGVFTAVAEPVDGSISLAVLESGNLAIGWIKEIDDGDDIVANAVQIVGPDGVNIGDPFLVDVGDLEAHSIAAAAGGGLAVTWANDDSNELFVRFFTETGLPMGDAILVDPSTFEESPRIGVLASGDAVVAWTDSLAGNSDVYARILSAPTYSPPSEGADSLYGNAGDNLIAALGGNDTVDAGLGDDTLDGGLGNDTLNGGGGFDSAVFTSVRSAYSLTVVGETTTVQGPDGIDTLTGIERLQFADGDYVYGPAGFAAPTLALAGFGSGTAAGGWDDSDVHPRMLADLNGDGGGDIVGFGEAGVYVSLAAGDGTFAAPFLASGGYGSSAGSGGWISQATTPRMLADINGDGALDIVGFGETGTYASLGAGDGTFAAPFLATIGFGSGVASGGWSEADTHPRMLVDLDFDGRADILGFGAGGTYVALANSNGTFAAPFLASAGYGSSPASGGWASQAATPRMLADVNGDGIDDLVGFAPAGVYVSAGYGFGAFSGPVLATTGFGSSAGSGGWADSDTHPRMLVDLNDDEQADILGFGDGGAYAALGNWDGTFGAPFLASPGYGSGAASGGWTSQAATPRVLADLNGDGIADLAGFTASGIYASYGDGAGAFGAPFLVHPGFGSNAGSGGWADHDSQPRMLVDLNGDGSADIFGFGESGVITAINASDWVLV